MAKLKDYPMADTFPYIDTMIKDINDNSGVKIISSSKSEISEDGRTWRRTITSTTKDKKEFTKIFRESLKSILSLGPTAQSVLWYIIDHLPIQQNKVIITNDDCMSSCGFKTAKSVRDGIMELLDKDILTRSTTSYCYWVNPLVLFNGDRIEFVRKYIYSED